MEEFRNYRFLIDFSLRGMRVHLSPKHYNKIDHVIA